MVTGTHVAFSTALYLGGAAILEYPTDPIAWGLAAFCSTLPDVDLPISRIGRPFFWLSSRLEKRFGHRTITHSVIALIAIATLAYPLRWFGHRGWMVQGWGVARLPELGRVEDRRGGGLPRGWRGCFDFVR